MRPAAPTAYEAPAVRDLGTLAGLTQSMSPAAGPLIPGQLVLAQLSTPNPGPGPDGGPQPTGGELPETGFAAGALAAAGAALAGAGLAVRRAVERRSR